MIIKRIVAISLLCTLSAMIVILIIGLFVPTKTLEKFSRANSTEQTVVAVDKNGNTIEGATVKVQADGSTVVVDATGQTVPDASAAAQPVATTPPPTTGTTTTPPPSSGGGTTTPPPSTGGGTTPAPTAPTISSFTASPGSVAYNGSSTLAWASNNATACTIATVGTYGASGTKVVSSLTATKQYSLTCTGAGGTSAAKYATVTVAAAPPVSSCGSGGSCSSADITPHATASDCRSAFTSGTSGQPTKAAYQITASFITSHNGQKNGVILSKLCGKTNYASNLRNVTGDHKGTVLSGKTYDGWIANFYLGPYN